jgi:hypothetical protein
MSVFGRTTAVVLVLGGLVLGGAVPVRADHHEECEHRMHQAEWRLHRAIERHGEGSPEAEHRRHQLEEIREHCGYYDHHRRHEEEREEHHEEHEEHEQMEHGY